MNLMAKRKSKVQPWHVILVCAILLIVLNKYGMLGRKAPSYNCDIPCTSAFSNQAEVSNEKAWCEAEGKTCTMLTCGTKFGLSCTSGGTTPCGGDRYEGEICTTTADCRCKNSAGLTLACIATSSTNKVCSPEIIGDGICGSPSGGGSEDCHNSPSDCACSSGSTCTQGTSMWYCKAASTSSSYCYCQAGTSCIKYSPTNQLCTNPTLGQIANCGVDSNEQTALSKCNSLISAPSEQNNCFCVENEKCVQEIGPNCKISCFGYGGAVPQQLAKSNCEITLSGQGVQYAGCYCNLQSSSTCVDKAYSSGGCTPECHYYWGNEDKAQAKLNCENIPTYVCGDTTCDYGEEDTCPGDCYSPGDCGDGICNDAIGETKTTCPSDCKDPGTVTQLDVLKQGLANMLRDAGIPDSMIPMAMLAVYAVGGIFALMLFMMLMQMMVGMMRPPSGGY